MDNDNIKISKVEVDILKEINKLKKSKLYDIFNRIFLYAIFRYCGKIIYEKD